MAIDPRRRYPFGQTAPMMYGAGTLNNASPMFQGPAYYNQMFNRPIQDWSQFMPTNSPLAGGGGINYQLPWGYGTGGGSGWGGAFGGGGGFMGGGLMGGGYPGGYGGGYPGGYGYPGGGYPGAGDFTGAVIPRPNPIFGPGNMWPIPTDPSLAPSATGTGPGGTEGPTFSGNYNEYGQELDQWGNVIDQGVPWQNTFLAPLGYKLGWNYGGAPGISSRWQDMGGVTDDDIDAMMMADADMGGVDSRYYPSTPILENWMDPQIGQPRYAPPATNAITGLLGGPGVDMTSGFLGPQVDDFANINAQPQVNLPGPQESWSAPAPAPAPAPVTPAWSPPSMTPTAPATPAVDNFAQVQAERQRANEFASAQQEAAARQQEAAARQQEAARVQEQLAYQQAESRLMQSRDRGTPSEAEIRQAMANDAQFGRGGSRESQARREAELGRENIAYAEETGLGRGWSVG